MTGTSYTDRLRELARFASQNYRLLLLTVVFFVGVSVGVSLFSPENAKLLGSLQRILENMHTVGSFSAALSELAVSCALPCILLLAMGLSGLSVCGIPAALFCIGVYGCSVGLVEAYLYSAGASGLTITLLLILPRVVVFAIALLIAAAESLRMSTLLGQQVLPNGGGTCLWADLKLYGMRYLLCTLLVFVGGLLDIGCRLLFGGLTAQM